MTPPPTPPEPHPSAASRVERYELVASVDRLLDGPATYLAFVFAVLTVIDVVVVTQGGTPPAVIGWLITAIWLFFLVHFLLGITLAPDRLRYLRSNWLTAVSLLIPFLRVVRVLRAVAIVRAANGVRVLAGFNRAARTLHEALAWSRAWYAVGLAVTAALLGSAGIYLFEGDAPGTEIPTYTDALWWSASTLTTIGAEHEPITVGGRVVGLMLMIGGLVLLGYIAGVLARVLFDARPARSG